METPKLLEYLPYGSFINPGFWHKLTDLKLDVDKLNETERCIWGYYSIVNPKIPLLEVDSTSYNAKYHTFMGLFMPGKLLNKNTIEQFKECDKSALIKSEGLKFWENVVNGNCVRNPSLINTFFVLTFADLKKYLYYYWFAVPTPANIDVTFNSSQLISKCLNDEQIQSVYKDHCNLDLEQRHFFLVRSSDFKVLKISDVVIPDDKNNLKNPNEYYFAFGDSSDSLKHTSWAIKNYIAFLLHHCPLLHGKSVNFIAYRINLLCSKLTCELSVIFNVTLPDLGGDVNSFLSLPETGGWIGWERNERGKLGPRMVNMKETFDPKCLAESSVDLNIKLMKWRALPDIDLDKIKDTKCLLLGAGTLGCSVARVLLGWGVRKIDFVDSSNVSYSNPVRQSLFNFEDCVQNKPKATAAAQNLKNIFPGVDSQGYQFNIPMPGHPVGNSMMEQTKENVEKLTELISESDIIFLLMDSRESRWLPTVLGMHFGKMVIVAALGFDTYLVMRHGVRTESNVEFKPVEGFKTIVGNELGCYFCNDVTAPGNSLKDRTLDQQCTVTRPGISQIAGALAVELAISLLQHDHGALAPAYYKFQKTSPEIDIPNDCILGILPYSIRGFLSTFTHVLPATERYKQCIACSEPVLKQYRDRGFEFLLEVFESSKSLEDLTGLSEIYNIDTEQIWEIDDSEEES